MRNSNGYLLRQPVFGAFDHAVLIAPFRP
jgi:hypothetical protein